MAVEMRSEKFDVAVLIRSSIGLDESIGRVQPDYQSGNDCDVN
jgi:hypothetical protein